MATTDVKLASSVAKDVELDAILLRSAKVESSVSGEGRPATLETRQLYGTRYELAPPTKLNVLVKFSIELLEAGKTSSLVRIDAEYLLIYGLPEARTHSDQALRCFAELNSLMHLWPYWRELVHTVVARVGLGSLTLPVYRVKAKPIQIEQAEVATEPDNATP